MLLGDSFPKLIFLTLHSNLTVLVCHLGVAKLLLTSDVGYFTTTVEKQTFKCACRCCFSLVFCLFSNLLSCFKKICILCRRCYIRIFLIF